MTSLTREFRSPQQQWRRDTPLSHIKYNDSQANQAAAIYHYADTALPLPTLRAPYSALLHLPARAREFGPQTNGQVRHWRH
ncbi:MAG: hypothetical protein ACRCRW_01590 [Aeromonadaceae bacterium]